MEAGEDSERRPLLLEEELEERINSERDEERGDLLVEFNWKHIRKETKILANLAWPVIGSYLLRFYIS